MVFSARGPVPHFLQALAEGVHVDVRGVAAHLVDPDLHRAVALDEPGNGRVPTIGSGGHVLLAARLPPPAAKGYCDLKRQGALQGNL